MNKTIGFIGGGRVARIILGGWKQAGFKPRRMTISDTKPEILKALQGSFPEIQLAPNNQEAAAQQIVFLAVHPPAVASVLEEIKSQLAPEAVVISLVPKFTLARLSAALGGFKRLARAIPNAPSVIGAGYNPIVFAPDLDAGARQEVLDLFQPLGDCPEVAEPKLEGYALLTAMGPTYLWFQLEALRETGRACGLTEADLVPALKRMVCGSARTLLESGLSPAEVMDLVPVKPLGEDEPAIKAIYQARLPALFEKIKPS